MMKLPPYPKYGDDDSRMSIPTAKNGRAQSAKTVRKNTE